MLPYSLEREHWFSWRAGVKLISSFGGWITSLSKARGPVKSAVHDQSASGEDPRKSFTIVLCT